MTRVLSLPGWNGSEPGHWQSLWERLDPRIVRVEQASWTHPSLDDWRARVEAVIASEKTPVVLVGHSLGATLAVHLGLWTTQVVGALLVAPPELSLPEFDSLTTVKTFDPVPLAPLPFMSTLVCSEDDRFLSLPRAEAWASAWGSTLVNVGKRGHLNADSGLETWPEGFELLRKLRARSPFSIDPRLASETHVIGRGPLSELRLYDDARYPWFLLVPRRSSIDDVSQLSRDDRAMLEAESTALAAGLREAFAVDKVNVGWLGNVVRQLHVHHVGRRLDDPAWPGPVWGHSPRVPLAAPIREARTSQLFSAGSISERFVRGPGEG